MNDDRQDPLIRRGALTLSHLVLTPDKGIDAFMRRKVQCDAVTAEQVQQLRGVLDALGFVVASPERSDWQKIERVWELLKTVPRPTSDSEVSALDKPDDSGGQADGAPTPKPQAASHSPAKKAAPPAAAPPDEDRAKQAADKPSARDIPETVMLSVQQVMGEASAATPFDGSLPAAPMPSGVFGTHEDVGATAAIDSAAIEAALRDLPAPSDDNLPMSLDDYASLVAHTEPGAPAATGEARRARHLARGIEDEAQRTAIDAAFDAYFSNRADAYDQYSAILDRWRAWLRRSQ